ncbi:AraC family transcriptional regulator [Paenibacillus spongiae]|uniref:AraC family transcriptional regulator n=1 Tax=Paenibacillus spongiae TaxID=2909671 RepID=A0ABY5SLP0_9BACL|nr:AraC family transcriptional regulator [Paenibacillus spongiae]UVI33163.1 AraC family transcriptional regulator [Paenibacillus spongiae]
MHYRQRIQHVLEYIETNLYEELSSAKLAGIAGFSKSHFLKVFEALAGYTIMSYIRNRRLHMAAAEINRGVKRIADIAYDHGFESHDVFGRAFKRAYGITPESYRKRQFVLPDFHKINLETEDSEEMIDAVEASAFVTIPEMKLIGIERRIEEGSLSPAELWPYYFENWEALFKDIAKLRIEPEKDIDYALTVDRDEEGFTYFIGIEVSSVDYIPEGAAARIIPKTKYAKFTAVGPVHESIARTYGYIYKHWFPQSDYQLQLSAGPIIEYYDMRCATHIGIPPERHEMDIYIPIEPVITEAKEVVELPPYKAAYYKATGAAGNKWKQVKKEAFDVMIEWTSARASGIDAAILPIRTWNNGGVADKDFYYEVFMDVTGLDLPASGDERVQMIEMAGGLYMVTPTLHRTLEPTGRAAWNWFESSHEYACVHCEGFEEFLIVDDKVTLETMIRIHIRAERRSVPGSVDSPSAAVPTR